MAAHNDNGPRLEAEGQTPWGSNSTDHERYMNGLAWRIRWLERHRHWWIRTVRGRWS